MSNISIVRSDALSLCTQAAALYIRVQDAIEENIPLDKEVDEIDLFEKDYVVAFDNGIPIGTCRLNMINGDTAKIERVVVASDYRKKGIGRIMIDEAEKWLIERGIKRIVIMSRDSAVGFYQRLGYMADPNIKEKGKLFTQIYTEKVVKEDD